MSDPPPEHSSDDHPDRPGDDAGQISQRVQRQQVSARVPESVAPGVFASGTLVINGQHEFIIDFLQSVTRPQQVAVRVVLPPTIIPGMLRAMRQNIKLFEERFGAIPELPKPPARDNSAGGGSGGGGDSPPSVDEIYEQLKMSDEVAAGTYANTVMITHAPSEFCFDFIGGFYPRSTVAARSKRGTVKSRCPPGTSTRCSSASAARSSATCSSTSVWVQTSKVASGKVSAARSWHVTPFREPPGGTSSQNSEQTSTPARARRKSTQGPVDDAS